MRAFKIADLPKDLRMRGWNPIAEFTIASVVKSALSTAPMLMRRHSRSGAPGVGRSQKLDIPFCTGGRDKSISYRS
jgi:hypothetical protein